MIPEDLYNELPEPVRHKVSALWERLGNRIEDYSHRRTALGIDEPSNPKKLKLKQLRPSVVLYLRWKAKHKEQAIRDLSAVKEKLDTYNWVDVRFSGVANFDPVDSQLQISHFLPGKNEEGYVSGYFEIPLVDTEERAASDLTHMRDFILGNEQWFRVVDQYNESGVRCLLVKRWVPAPSSWDKDVMDYWTGYVYRGSGLVGELPSSVGAGGAETPRISYPNTGDPREAEWIGWDNNYMEHGTEENLEDRYVEPMMTEEEARRINYLLARAVRDVWHDYRVDPRDMYREDYNPPWMEEGDD